MKTWTPIVVFLDTSIFEKYNFLKGRDLLKLFELSKQNKIKIKLVDITRREIKERIRKRLTESRGKIRKLSSLLNSDCKIVKNLDLFDSVYKKMVFSVSEKVDEIDNSVSSILERSNVEIIPTSTQVVDKVFDDYFKEIYPFNSGSKKSEFPDAFVLHTIENFARESLNAIILCSTDGDMTNYEGQTFEVRDNIVSILGEVAKREASDRIYKLLLEYIETSLIEDTPGIEAKSELIICDIMYEFTPDIDLDLESIDFESINDFELEESTIIGIENNIATIDIEGSFDFIVNADLNDFSGAIYDKEDGVWFGVRSVSYQYKGHSKYNGTLDLEFEPLDDKISVFYSELQELNLDVDHEFEIVDEQASEI